VFEPSDAGPQFLELRANRSRWSVRAMAQSAGVSKAAVQRLWSANDIKSHVGWMLKPWWRAFSGT
jgi:hypothetical protein